MRPGEIPLQVKRPVDGYPSRLAQKAVQITVIDMFLFLIGWVLATKG